MKRAQGVAGPGTGPQPYAAPLTQSFPNQQNMYPNYPGASGNAQTQATPQPQYWGAGAPTQPPQQQQYNQQYAQVYPPDYPPSTNQLYQQPAQYNHNYANTGYTNPQQNYQQHYYQNPSVQQSYPPNASNNDGWEDNWDWGWDESAKQAQKAQNAAQHQNQTLRQEQVFHNANNANVIDDSFTSTNTWNWAMDDKKGSQDPSINSSKQETIQSATLSLNPIENNTTPESSISHSTNNIASAPTDEVRTLSDRDAVKERMPNLALGKRLHLDNLTPQWSIESQMSQESSDGPQTHSESTYRSDTQSRNSNSPGPNTNNSNFNYSQLGLEEGYTQHSERSMQSDELTIADSTQTGIRRDSHNELPYAMQSLTLANHENLLTENTQLNQTIELKTSQQTGSGGKSPPGPSPASDPPHEGPLPPQGGPHVAPPPGGWSASASLPLAPTPPAAAQLASLPTGASQSPSSSATLPPPNFPPPSGSQNPFKHAGPLAHRSKASSSSAPAQPFPPPGSLANLNSPAAVGKVSRQSRTPVGFEANLETTPDNSERPDHPQPSPYRPPPAPAPVSHQVPDNMEVAPQNDRNEYLQTAHLSSGDYGENGESRRGGLRRLVVGQQEAAGAGDEPPPGLARMVPGQHTEGYMERHIDGQPTDGGGTYRRPLALDRMVPGEPGDADYPHYQGSGFGNGNEQRVVTGLERDFRADAGPARAREHNVDGSDYSEPPPTLAPAPAQRDGTMEGENLQDLSAVSSGELSFREREGPAPPAGAGAGARGARRSSEDTDRDRPHEGEPRRARRRDPGEEARYPPPRYEREDRMPAREERRSDRERRERRAREASPGARRPRRSARSHRYETEDTDYCSDRGERRTYAARPEESSRRHGSRRAGSPRRDQRREREYRPIDPSRQHSHRRRHRQDATRRRVTFSRDAKANDSSRSEGSVSPPSRAESREATATDEDDRRRPPRHASRRTIDPYYDAGLYAEPGYLAQRQQYEYYARLRAADPAAYMLVYQRLMAAADRPRLPDRLDGYGPYEAARGEERASVHSGRSSTAGHKGNDTYYVSGREGSLRGAASLRTDVSDRDLTTEVSLPTNLETSTVRSDRLTPHRFSTAHIKGSISSGAVVVVRPVWPVDGLPATVQVLALPALLARDPRAADLDRSPGPLLQGVTHKKTVIEYCAAQARGGRGAKDPAGYALLWDLLALLLRQNGVVVGSDIAELLMKNTRDYEYKLPTNKPTHNSTRRVSEASIEAVDFDSTENSLERGRAESTCGPPAAEPAADEAAALHKLRDHLIYGDRQEALEWALSCGLWGHALALAGGGARARAQVAARFLQATPRRDPLHTLYATLHHASPPAATCLSEEGWGDWRPHAAILLSNPTRPDHDTKTLTTLGDSLASRGLVYCAQFCYLTGGVPFSRHPLAPLAPSGAPAPAQPPRLSLLFAEPHACNLLQLATTQAIIATEIYEYALSLNRDYVIPELQVYKLVMACRLVDCGQHARALAYVQGAARALARSPRDYSPALAGSLAQLADRLRYHDPALQAGPEEGEGEGEGEGSPRHQQWLRDVQDLAHIMQAEASQQASPLHAATSDYYATQQQPQQQEQQQQQYSWDQAHRYQQQLQQQEGGPPLQAPPPELEPPEYGAPQQPGAPPSPPPPAAGYEDWSHTEEHHAQAYGGSPYWPGDTTYGYGEEAGGAGEPPAPTITMPGAPPAAGSRPYPHYEDDHTHTAHQERDSEPASSRKEPRGAESPAKGGGGGAAAGRGGGGWLGGILTKLSLRPPNQMILPDDKNPSIVWDAEHKRWRDVAGDSPPAGGAPPPPPRLQDLPHSQNTSTPLHSPAGAPPPPVSNIFKMQKGRHIKKSYVDVFNPGGGAPRAAPAPDSLGPPPAPGAPLGPAPTYFVPDPALSGVYSPAQADAAADHTRSGI